MLRIAEALAADGQDAEALKWLGRGLAEFTPDSRLRDLAADCHLRAGRVEEVLDLLWANFTHQPTVLTYQRLCMTAGTGRPSWRERALELLRAQPCAADRSAGPVYGEPAGHSTLVEALLWEGDTAAAWQAAQIGGCRSPLWLTLARARATTHPADALPVLKHAAERAVEHKNRTAYREAARLLIETQTLAGRCGESDGFADYLVRLRADHKPKRALREELDRARLPG